MTTLVVLFNLKPGVAVAAYESWARGTDLPIVRKLPSVKQFRVLRCAGLLGGGGKPPYQYVEILELTSAEQLGSEVQSPEMQRVVSEFAGFADAPSFIVTEEL